jgi:anionic cell wall polymer biosynthesis LytR-Cps2A-Psr (LCP) family protein
VFPNAFRQEPVVQYVSSAVLDSSDDDRSADERRGDGRRDGPRPGGKKKGRGKRPKDPLWARLLVVFGALLMLGSGGTIVGAKVLVGVAAKSVTQQSLLGSGGTSAKHATISGAKNILLVGVDTRVGQTTMGSRSDSILILHIPASHDQGYLLSIPRDTWADIPKYDNGKSTWRGGQGKINAAFEYGSRSLTGAAAAQHGFELLEQTIRALPGMSGLTFDAGAIVDFDGFKDVVTALGGVYMCVDERTISIHTGFNDKTHKEQEPYYFKNDLPTSRVPGVTPVVYEKGCSTMSAWRALDYVRQRDKLENNDGDYGRQRHQQQFIKAVFSQILSSGTLSSPTKLSKVLNTVGKAMTIDRGNFSIEDWIFAMKGIGASDLTTVKTNGGKFVNGDVNGQSVQELNADSLELLQCLKTDTVGAFVTEHPDWVAA